MKQHNNLLSWIALVEGIVLLLAAVLRAISINNLVVGISTGDISKHYGASVLFDWGLASLLLGLTGVWLLFLAGDLKRRRLKAWWQALIIAICISIFSSFYWFYFPFSRRLPVFLLLGLCLLLPLLIQSSQFRRKTP